MHRPSAILLCSTLLALSSRAEEIDPLAAYRRFLAQWQPTATGQVQRTNWETVFEATPDPQKPFWGTPFKQVEVIQQDENAKPAPEVKVKTEQVDGITVLSFDAEKCEAGFLPVGGKVKGDFALEIVCRSTSERLNDLSLILDGLAKGPGFQFGGYNNTRNLLRTDDPEGTWGFLADLPVDCLIVKGQWHTVRLEIVQGFLRAFVDDKQLGTVGCGKAYRPDLERQPLFYIYDSRAQLKRYTVQQPKGAVVPAAATAELETKIAGLIGLLDHDEFKVRNEAQKLLKSIGPWAFRQLRDIIPNGTLEQRLRAREILGLPEE